MQSLRHPLHEAIFGAATLPDEEDGFSCGARQMLRVSAAAQPTFGLLCRVEGPDDNARSLLARYDQGAVFIDANTDIRGFDRDGVPFIEQGDEFSLTLRACTGAGETRKVVAKIILG